MFSRSLFSDPANVLVTPPSYIGTRDPWWCGEVPAANPDDFSEEIDSLRVPPLFSEYFDLDTIDEVDHDTELGRYSVFEMYKYLQI